MFKKGQKEASRGADLVGLKSNITKFSKKSRENVCARGQEGRRDWIHPASPAVTAPLLILKEGGGTCASASYKGESWVKSVQKKVLGAGRRAEESRPGRQGVSNDLFCPERGGGFTTGASSTWNRRREGGKMQPEERGKTCAVEKGFASQTGKRVPSTGGREKGACYEGRGRLGRKEEKRRALKAR